MQTDEKEMANGNKKRTNTWTHNEREREVKGSEK